MKINTKAPNTIKYQSFWPLTGALITLTIWFNNKHLLLLFLFVIFVFLFVHTLFFSNYELYIDTKSKKVIKKIRWLFIKRKTEINLKKYEAIYISYCSAINREGGGPRNSRYNVVLVHKYASNKTAYGTNVIENIVIENYIENIQEAKNITLKYSNLLGVDAAIEKQVAKFYPDLFTTEKTGS